MNTNHIGIIISSIFKSVNTLRKSNQAFRHIINDLESFSDYSDDSHEE